MVRYIQIATIWNLAEHLRMYNTPNPWGDWALIAEYHIRSHSEQPRTRIWKRLMQITSFLLTSLVRLKKINSIVAETLKPSNYLKGWIVKSLIHQVKNTFHFYSSIFSTLWYVDNIQALVLKICAFSEFYSLSHFALMEYYQLNET